VVFTDLANYTFNVGRADRQGLRDLIATHEKLVAPLLEKHDGRVVKNIGDSYMAIFGAATDAVRAGLELIETIPKQGGFGIRAAMATGDVEEIDGDAFGEAVNLASRVLSKTPEGEVWYSPATHLCMNHSEIAWEAVGRFTLKGIAAETPLYRAVPTDKCWLPEPVSRAAKAGRLVRIRQGDPLPTLPPRPVILLENFDPDSSALRDVVDRLPVVDPASLWLQAYSLPPSDRLSWQRAGRGLVIGTGVSVEKAISDTRRPSNSLVGSDTIILDVNASAQMELVMAGLALPRVPMSEVVSGYSYDLLFDGRWVNRSDHAIARVHASADGVALTALSPGLMVSGRQAHTGKAVRLSGGDRIQAPSGIVTFMSLSGRGYTGLLLSDSSSRLGITTGQQAELGREPRFPGLALPDRRGQENIRWCVGMRAARARENGFTLDRALAGRRQCAVRVNADGATLVSLHQRCPTYIVDRQQLVKITAATPVGPGTLIVAGTSVVAVREPEI